MSLEGTEERLDDLDAKEAAEFVTFESDRPGEAARSENPSVEALVCNEHFSSCRAICFPFAATESTRLVDPPVLFDICWCTIGALVVGRLTCFPLIVKESGCLVEDPSPEIICG
jgi:hypothetical protein